MSERVGPGFGFSQSSLTAFAQCRRRFFLRYVRKVIWPAPLTPEIRQWEEAAQRGRLFHHWVQQDVLGLDVEPAVRDSGDALLQKWWRSFRTQPPSGVPEGRIFSEVKLSTPVGRYRLLAKFDRVVLGMDGRAVIVDWKTGRKRPEQSQHAGSWQTLVYRHVLVEAGRALDPDRAILPDRVSLVYWHAQYPDLLLPIAYSRAAHEEAGRTLAAAVAEIASLEGEKGFLKTQDLEPCRRCEYRTYCERRVAPADDGEIDEDELEEDPIPEAEL